jgi:hypothetical protein
MEEKTINYLDFEKNPNIINDLVDEHIRKYDSCNLEWILMIVSSHHLKIISNLNTENCLVIYVALDNLNSTILSLIEKYNLKENDEYKSLPLYMEGAIIIYTQEII